MFTLTKAHILNYYTNVLFNRFKGVKGEIARENIPDDIIQKAAATGFPISKDELIASITAKRLKKMEVDNIKSKFPDPDKDAKAIVKAATDSKEVSLLGLADNVFTTSKQNELDAELCRNIDNLQVTAQEMNSVVARKANPNANHDGMPIIYRAAIAAIKGNKTAVDTLLEAKAEVTGEVLVAIAKDFKKFSVMNPANNSEIFSSLLAANFDFDVYRKLWDIAANDNNFELAILLLKQGIVVEGIKFSPQANSDIVELHALFIKAMHSHEGVAALSDHLVILQLKNKHPLSTQVDLLRVRNNISADNSEDPTKIRRFPLATVLSKSQPASTAASGLSTDATATATNTQDLKTSAGAEKASQVGEYNAEYTKDLKILGKPIAEFVSQTFTNNKFLKVPSRLRSISLAALFPTAKVYEYNPEIYNAGDERRDFFALTCPQGAKTEADILVEAFYVGKDGGKFTLIGRNSAEVFKNTNLKPKACMTTQVLNSEVAMHGEAKLQQDVLDVYLFEIKYYEEPPRPMPRALHYSPPRQLRFMGDGYNQATASIPKRNMGAPEQSVSGPHLYTQQSVGGSAVDNSRRVTFNGERYVVGATHYRIAPVIVRTEEDLLKPGYDTNQLAARMELILQARAQAAYHATCREYTYRTLCDAMQNVYNTDAKSAISSFVTELTRTEVEKICEPQFYLDKLAVQFKIPERANLVAFRENIVESINQKYPQLASVDGESILLDIAQLHEKALPNRALIKGFYDDLAQAENRVWERAVYHTHLHKSHLTELTLVRMCNIADLLCAAKYVPNIINNKVYFDFGLGISKQSAATLVDRLNQLNNNDTAAESIATLQTEIILSDQNNALVHRVRINLEFLRSEKFLNLFQQTFQKLCYGLSSYSDNAFVERALIRINLIHNVPVSEQLRKLEQLSTPFKDSAEFQQALVDLKAVLNKTTDPVDSYLKEIGVVRDRLHKIAVGLCMPRYTFNAVVSNDAQTRVDQQFKSAIVPFLTNVIAADITPIKDFCFLLEKRYPGLTPAVSVTQLVAGFIGYTTVKEVPTKAVSADTTSATAAAGDYKAAPAVVLAGVQPTVQQPVVVTSAANGLAATAAVQPQPSQSAAASTPAKTL